ncbi:MAG: hypothetical protein GY802_15370 [Gammaproteobacteria bacterium]|nr:hypothetical protein [Gammaproteobacteria bacterium]
MDRTSPRIHLVADKNCGGHFNVLRGYIAPTNTAGIKVVVDYFEPIIAPLLRDRSPGPDVEAILEHFAQASFIDLSR